MGVLTGAGIIIFLLIIATFSPMSSSEILGFDPVGNAARRAAAEAEDEEQMLALQNRFRREAGEREVAEEEFHAEIQREQGDTRYGAPPS
ncbi:MAG TPA: hypothetical protein VHX88_02470 [Solirubrobacteraceae bacterium]|nr:hypothetical protein [Solirubrobacteraceae bacterium]